MELMEKFLFFLPKIISLVIPNVKRATTTTNQMREKKDQCVLVSFD